MSPNPPIVFGVKLTVGGKRNRVAHIAVLGADCRYVENEVGVDAAMLGSDLTAIVAVVSAKATCLYTRQVSNKSTRKRATRRIRKESAQRQLTSK